MFQKNYTLFCNNFFIREPNFIIFGSNMPEENIQRILYFPPHLNCVLLLYLVTGAASLTNVHRCRSEFLRTPFLQTFSLKILMNNAVQWRVMNAGLSCNLTRGLMHFNAPLLLRTKSFTVSTFSAVRTL